MTFSIEEARAFLQNSFPEGYHRVITFEITDVGSITVDSAGVRIGTGDASLRITSDSKTFTQIVKGEDDPRSAFLNNRLRISGDLALAMEVAQSL